MSGGAASSDGLWLALPAAAPSSSPSLSPASSAAASSSSSSAAALARLRSLFPHSHAHAVDASAVRALLSALRTPLDDTAVSAVHAQQQQQQQQHASQQQPSSSSSSALTMSVDEARRLRATVWCVLLGVAGRMPPDLPATRGEAEHVLHEEALRTARALLVTSAANADADADEDAAAAALAAQYVEDELREMHTCVEWLRSERVQQLAGESHAALDASAVSSPSSSRAGEWIDRVDAEDLVVRMMALFVGQRGPSTNMRGVVRMLVTVLHVVGEPGAAYQCFYAMAGRLAPGTLDDLRNPRAARFSELLRLLLQYHAPDLHRVVSGHARALLEATWLWLIRGFATELPPSTCAALWEQLLIRGTVHTLVFVWLQMLLDARELLEELFAASRHGQIHLSSADLEDELHSIPWALLADRPDAAAHLVDGALWLEHRTPSSVCARVGAYLLGDSAGSGALISGGVGAAAASASDSAPASPAQRRLPLDAPELLCVQVSADDVLAASVIGYTTTSELRAGVRFITLDCRARASYMQGHLPTAIHVDPRDVERDLSGFIEFVGQLEGMRGAAHFALVGDADSQSLAFVSTVALHLLNHGFPYVSILRGGQAEVREELEARNKLSVLVADEANAGPAPFKPAKSLAANADALAEKVQGGLRRFGDSLGTKLRGFAGRVKDKVEHWEQAQAQLKLEKEQRKQAEREQQQQQQQQQQATKAKAGAATSASERPSLGARLKGLASRVADSMAAAAERQRGARSDARAAQSLAAPPPPPAKPAKPVSPAAAASAAANAAAAAVDSASNGGAASSSSSAMLMQHVMGYLDRIQKPFSLSDDEDDDGGDDALGGAARGLGDDGRVGGARASSGGASADGGDMATHLLHALAAAAQHDRSVALGIGRLLCATSHTYAALKVRKDGSECPRIVIVTSDSIAAFEPLLGKNPRLSNSESAVLRWLHPVLDVTRIVARHSVRPNLVEFTLRGRDKPRALVLNDLRICVQAVQRAMALERERVLAATAAAAEAQQQHGGGGDSLL